MEFLRTNWPWLLAPMLMTLASGFGQTFFIAIFGDSLRAEFGLSHGGWGGNYMMGTLASAVAMLAFGSLADKVSAQKLVFFVMIGFVGFALLMAMNPFLWLLPVIIFGIRFCGQGMMMHISQVVTARWFRANRGKAMAYAIFGIAFAEAVFPMVGVRVIEHVGWRMTWVIAAALIALLGVVLLRRLETARKPQTNTQNERRAGMDQHDWTRKEMLGHWVFWVAFPATLAMPFLSTIFFFQIPVLATSKSWALGELAMRLPIFSLTAFSAMLITGGMLDCFGTRRIMPYIYVPMVFGFLILSQVITFGGLVFALFIMGLAQGAAAALSSVFWADFYGTTHLGAIRSVASGVMVFATSMGPFLSGSLLDRGIGYETQLMMMAGYALLAVVLMGIVSLGTKGRF